MWSSASPQLFRYWWRYVNHDANLKLPEQTHVDEMPIEPWLETIS